VTNEDKRLLITVAEGYAGDNVLENWETVAEEFRRDTGFLRPGKSYPLECQPDPEEQRSAWNTWLKARNVKIAAALRALIAEKDNPTTATTQEPTP